MTVTLYDSFYETAKTDLESAKLLTNQGLSSNAFYPLEQCLEKGSKAIFAYYTITHEKKSEADTYDDLKCLSHNVLKAIPKIYSKIFRIEEYFINNIPTINPNLATNPNFPRTKDLLLDQIRGLRQRICDDNVHYNKIFKEKKNLLRDYRSEVEKAYYKYTKHLNSIPSLARNILQDRKMTGSERSTQVHPFDKFFGLTVYLFPLILVENNLYRYPSLKHQNENLRELTDQK